ncbi:MAG: DUF2314 domain-containing protein [Hyphomonadaceae bacterium]|nr:DUF2314 domain-containing protein [Hyphomonadaceae bacterium]
MRIVLLAAALALAACPLVGCSGAEDSDAKFQRDLAAASEQARGKLDYFWEHFEAGQPNEYDFQLKAAFPRRDGQEGTEDAWVENLARGADKYVGELMVDPLYLGDLREGAIMEFAEPQIVDWSFISNDKLIGGYTTRVMLPRMDAERAEGLRSMLGENPK